MTTWLAVPHRRRRERVRCRPKPAGLPYAAAAFPKLTILLDADSSAPTADQSQWSTIVRQPGRGPTLRLQATEAADDSSRRLLAAIEAVWPDLGPKLSANRLK